MNHSTKVLVVGGGFAGLCAANALSRSLSPLSVTLVTSHEYFEFVPSILRCIVRPAHIRRVGSCLNDRAFDFVHASVVSLSTNVAELRLHGQHSTLTRIEFDYCVWAVGTGYSSPIQTSPSLHSLHEREEELLQIHDKLVSANNIHVIGGGLVGVELAAELAGGLPLDKSPRIKLSTSAHGLIPRLPVRARKHVETWLLSRGVDIVLERVQRPLQTQGIEGDEGESAISRRRCDGPLRADVTFWCTGPERPGDNHALVTGGATSQDQIDSRGRVLVLPSLALRSAPNIFAVGDCAMVPGELDRDGHFGEKTAYSAMEAGRMAARNIVALALAKQHGGSSPRLECFPNDAFPLGVFPRLFCISLYENDGCLCIGPIVITGTIAALSKRVIEAVGSAAMSGSRVCDIAFLLLERAAFFVAALLQTVSGAFSRRTHRAGKQDRQHDFRRIA